jgi:hypothetical protein
MRTTQHKIISKSKDHPARRAMLIDFELDAGEAVASDIVVQQTGWTLYCLDQGKQCAVFVKTSETLDVMRAPFFRMAQYEQAEHVLLMPWEDLHRVAAHAALPANLIFIFNIGRSGTTLVSHMLDKVEGVYSLSEPNAQLDVVMNRFENGPLVTRQLLESCTRMLCRKADGSVPEHVAFKLYSQCLFNCADYHAAFPTAKFVFLYRDAIGWGNSVYKMMRGYGMSLTLDAAAFANYWRITSAGYDIRYLEHYVSPQAEVYVPEQLIGASWCLHLETYMQLFNSGVPFLALRYNEIVSQRDHSTTLLLQHCALSSTALDHALAVFAQDSQQGSGIGKDNLNTGFTAESETRLLQTLSLHAQFKSAEFILPDIYAAA